MRHGSQPGRGTRSSRWRTWVHNAADAPAPSRGRYWPGEGATSGTGAGLAQPGPRVRPVCRAAGAAVAPRHPHRCCDRRGGPGGRAARGPVQLRGPACTVRRRSAHRQRVGCGGDTASGSLEARIPGHPVHLAAARRAPAFPAERLRGAAGRHAGDPDVRNGSHVPGHRARRVLGGRLQQVPWCGAAQHDPCGPAGGRQLLERVPVELVGERCAGVAGRARVSQARRGNAPGGCPMAGVRARGRVLADTDRGDRQRDAGAGPDPPHPGRARGRHPAGARRGAGTASPANCTTW